MAAKKKPAPRKKPAAKKPAKKTKKFSAVDFWNAPMKPVKKAAPPEPKPVDPYHSEYDGTYTMKDYDAETNALKRWFENFKVERYVTFANEYECLIVEEVPASGKTIKKRQVCKIENAGANEVRVVKMDHTAPPAPMVFFAAKQRYVPPPPKSAADLRKEEEWYRMRSMGFIPRYHNVPIRKVSPSILRFDPEAMMKPLKMEMTVEYVEEIEWVRDDRRQQYQWEPSSKSAAPPPAPRHRRN